MNKKRRGVVLRWGSRGFGFIQDSETRVEYYAHISAVANNIGLAPGVQVTFEISPAETTKGARAALLITPLPVAEVGHE